MEAYKEEYNSDLRLSTICVKGYRYLVYDSAPRYAVQIWENGPDGPRLSQCPRKSDAAAAPEAPAEPDMKDAPGAQGR